MFRLPAICVLVSFIALPAATGQVSGEFKAGARKPIRPKYAVAFDDRDQRDARNHIVAVVLSEMPVDVAAAVAELDPHTQVINQDGMQGHNYVLLWVRPDGEVSMNATYSEKMVQFMDTTKLSLKAELSVNTPDKVAGRLFLPAPVKTMNGESYSVDLKFSVDVTRLPAATKLPADGGDPGRAFGLLTSAIAKKNWQGIIQNVTEKNRTTFTDADNSPKENLDGAIETLGFWLPKKIVKIAGGELRGETAVLEVEGEIFGAQKALYLVRMVRNAKQWLFDRATNAGFIE